MRLPSIHFRSTRARKQGLPGFAPFSRRNPHQDLAFVSKNLLSAVTVCMPALCAGHWPTMPATKAVRMSGA
jgi:hypothetical protein